MAGEEETKTESSTKTVMTTVVTKTSSSKMEEKVVVKKDLMEEEEVEKKEEEKKDEEKKEGKDDNAKGDDATPEAADTSASEDKKSKKKKKEAAPPPPPAVHKKDFQQDVVYLYQFNRCHKIPSISPYCLKVETWLKINGIKYENVDHKSRLRSKRGLLPFVELNGEEIPDSDIIIRTLSKKFEKDMDEGLDREQKNIQVSTLAMLDHHLLWISAHWRARHIDNIIKGYKLNLQTMTGYNKIPNLCLNFAFKHTFFRKMMKKVKATGLAGYTDEELDNLGKNDLKVLSDLLGDKQFFFGDEPRTLDISAFAQLAMLLCVDSEVPCPLRDYIEKECTNLVGHFNRVKDRAWGDDWDKAIGDSLEMNPHLPKPEVKKEENEKADEKKEGKEGDKDEKEKEEKEKEEKQEPEKKDEENKDSEKK